MQTPRSRPVLVAIGLCAIGCFTSDDGLDPLASDKYSFYFPTAIVASPGLTSLYVVSSDFDLQFNGGTVKALDLVELRKTLETLRDALNASAGAKSACSSVQLVHGDRTESLAAAEDKDRIIAPGPCKPLDRDFVNSLAINAVSIGAFASGAVLAQNPVPPGAGSTGARLFMTVRGDPSVTYIDVPDDRSAPTVSICEVDPTCFSCNRDGNKRCNDDHKIGRDPAENLRHITMPVEPVGIAASDDGVAMVVANQTTNQASLIVQPRPASAGIVPHPRLEFFISDLPPGPTDVAAVPIPKFVSASPDLDYQPGFLMTFRGSAEVDLLRFNDDHQSNPPRPFIARAFAEGITVNSSGVDSRGLAVDPSERQACEAACSSDDLDCLAGCLGIPLRLFVANRAPTTLLVGEVRTEITGEAGSKPTGALDTVTIFDSVPVAFGASKIGIGHIIDANNVPRLRVFAVTFDSRLIFSYDPESRRVETVIHTGRGPHAIAFDTAADGSGKFHSLLYVAHFTDSYVGVVDLDQRNASTYGQMFASVGTPVAPAEAK